MKWWILVILLLVLVVYVVVGGVIFMVLESANEEEGFTAAGSFRTQFLENKTCISTEEFNELARTLYKFYDNGIACSNNTTEIERTWTPHTSIYFATTVVTTIGYGNISPSTPGGRVFCIFFALIGIPLCLVVLAEIGNKMTNITKRMDKVLQKKIPITSERPKVMKIIRCIIVHTISVALFVFIPAAIFNAVEEDWTYGDGVYYSFITLTTIGFGDYVAGFNNNQPHRLYRILVAFWILIGLAWMSTLIATIQELLDNKVSDIGNKSENITKKEVDVQDNVSIQ